MNIPIEFPDGLVGEIAEYIYKSSGKPLKETALLAALGLIAGISARSFNISLTGLNMYFVFISDTGRGKDGIIKGIGRIKHAVYKETYKKVSDYLGPGKLSSGQALVKAVSKQPCFLSIFGEFGKTLENLNDKRAPHYTVELKRVLLELYALSGEYDFLSPMVYVDDTKNTEEVRSPNMSFIGETNPSDFYGNVTPKNITEGFISRLFVVEYVGPVQLLNSDENRYLPVPKSIINGVANLISIADKDNEIDSCIKIDIDDEAKVMLNAFEEECVNKVNELPRGSPEGDLLLRAHLNALKLSGIVAVGINPISPVVNQKTALWAISFVESSVNYMIAKIIGGNINDTSCNAQENAIKQAIDKYENLSYEKRIKLKVPPLIAEEKYAIPYSYLRKKKDLAAFKTDRRGATRALQETIKDMVASDILKEIRLDVKDSRLNSAIYEKGESW